MQKSSEKVTYLKAYPLKDYNDIQRIKADLDAGCIVIVRFTPLIKKSLDELSKAIDETYKYVMTIGGDIARLGEDRIVITPPGIKIFRESGLKY
ncbi:MAG: cell division protein SepF [Conexivisphaerales archaeon]